VKPFTHWSATQVTTFRLCQRKWYLSKIVGMEQPETQALLDGKRYAEEAERFFLTGETDGLSSVTRPLIALAASGKIPGPRTRPGSLLHVEHPIGVDRRAVNATGVALLAVDGLPAEGYMDLLDLRAGYPVVWDQKTTKDRKWIKEPDQLRTDVQMTLYAAATVLKHQTVYGCAPEAVGVAHIALLKPPKAAEGVVVGPVYLDLEHIETQWQGIQATVREMAQVALAAAPDRVTPTWSACTAFGGCAFLDTCKAIKTLTTSTEGSTTMSLLSTLAAKRAAALASPTTPTAAPVAVRPGLAASIAAQLAKPGQITPADAPASPSLAGIAAALKPGAVRPVIAAVPTPVVFPLIAEVAPVVVPVVAVVELAPVAVVAEVAASKRQPRNGTPRLVALGWSEVEIARMSCERKHEILDGGLKPPPVVAAVEVTDQPAGPAEFVDWDLNSEVSLNEALRLGWDYQQLLVVSDEIFGRILTESLLASEWDIDGDGFDLSRRKPPTQAEVKATFVQLEQVLLVPGPGDRPVEVVEVAEPVVVRDPVETQACMDRIIQSQDAWDKFTYETETLAPVPTLTLLIGCRPSKGMQPRELGDILAPAMREIESMKKVSYWDLLPYNEGGKLLATSLLMHPLTGVVVVDPAAPYANAVLAVLLPMASVVVRA
jgi:hypothetical protein